MKQGSASMLTESCIDARRSERKPVRIAVIMLSESDDRKVQRQPYTLDLSQYGLRLQASIPLAQGQIVELTTCEAPDYAVRGRAIWSGSVGSQHEGEVGFELLDPLQMPA